MVVLRLREQSGGRIGMDYRWGEQIHRVLVIIIPDQDLFQFVLPRDVCRKSERRMRIKGFRGAGSVVFGRRRIGW